MRGNNGNAGLVDDYPSELLFHLEGGRTLEVGPWARDLVRLGRTLASTEPGTPLSFALSLPTLDFAGPLVAAGFIAEKAKQRHNGTERAELFDQLCTLVPGTPVVLRLDNGKTVHAKFEDVTTMDGEPWAAIRYEQESKGNSRQFINKTMAHRVVFVAGPHTGAVENVVGRTANVQPGLAEGFVADGLCLRDVILRSVPECALIGVVKTLSDELCDTEFVARNGVGSGAIGRLQDIVRAANFMRADECFHTRLFPINAASSQIEKWGPPLVIFCGSSAYLNQAGSFPAAHHVALLSPTEHNFDAAVAALNEAFLRKVGEIPDINWPVPERVPAMAFQRRFPTSQ